MVEFISQNVQWRFIFLLFEFFKLNLVLGVLGPKLAAFEFDLRFLFHQTTPFLLLSFSESVHLLIFLKKLFRNFVQLGLDFLLGDHNSLLTLDQLIHLGFEFAL